MLRKQKKRIAICTEIINDLIQSVINSKKEISISEMEQQYLRHSYSDNIVSSCIKEYGLTINDESSFIAWPVFLGTGIEEINICAVNFGALTLLEKNIQKDLFTNNQKNKYINAVVNVLVVTNLTRNNNGKTVRYWPTHIDLSNRVESGTINQATLSLVSLLKLGFLSGVSFVNSEKPTQTQIKNRFRFIIENLNWVLDLQVAAGATGAAWAYAENCKNAKDDKKIFNAILPSQFCYEALMRYYNFFVSTPENTAIVNEIQPDLLTRISEACRAYEKWIVHEQREDGGYRRNNNSHTSSFAHSCCATLAFAYAENKNRTVLNNLIKYLLKNHNNFNFPINDILDNYKYSYEVSNNIRYLTDVYEIFPEALFIINSCKNIDNGSADLLNPYYKFAMRGLIYIAYEKLFQRVKTISIENTDENTVIEGRQEMLAHKYPIYTLYYSKICFERLRDNDMLPKEERKKYISVPIAFNPKLLGLTLLLLICVGIACYISATDTIISLILAFATFLVPTIFHLIIRNNKNSQK